MSRQQDLLFCKIALSTGMVSEEQAQKCLNLCERREKEGNRRPTVGAVFSKYKIMRASDVQRVYEAVNKRLRQAPGSRVGRSTTKLRRTPERTPRGVSRPSRGEYRYARPAQRSRRKVDPNTLWMGIGFGLVFVGVLATIIFLYISSTSRGPAETGREASVVAGSGTSQPAATRGGSDGAGAPPAGMTPEKLASGGIVPPTPKHPVIDPQFHKMHRNVLTQARRDGLAYGEADRAIAQLEKFAEQQKHMYKAYPNLKSEVDRTLGRIRDSVAGDGEPEEVEIGDNGEEDEGNGAGEETDEEDGGEKEEDDTGG